MSTRPAAFVDIPWTRTALCGLLIAASLTLVAPARAVTLVTPTGTPVGGQWQQWADEAHVPTLSGDLIVVVNDAVSMCAGADYGCSISPNDQLNYHGPAMTFVDSYPDGTGTTQDQFYEELGHQFDWADLTTAERTQFATVWGSDLPWWDSASSLARGQEDGLEFEFALDYADCAIDQNWQISWVPQISLTQLDKTCALISQIGQQVGATPASTPTVYQIATPKRRSRKHHKTHSERHAKHLTRG